METNALNQNNKLKQLPINPKVTVVEPTIDWLSHLAAYFTTQDTFYKHVNGKKRKFYQLQCKLCEPRKSLDDKGSFRFAQHLKVRHVSLKNSSHDWNLLSLLNIILFSKTKHAKEYAEYESKVDVIRQKKQEQSNSVRTFAVPVKKKPEPVVQIVPGKIGIFIRWFLAFKNFQNHIQD